MATKNESQLIRAGISEKLKLYTTGPQFVSVSCQPNLINEKASYSVCLNLNDSEIKLQLHSLIVTMFIRGLKSKIYI
jgi:hypothetical protein